MLLTWEKNGPLLINNHSPILRPLKKAQHRGLLLLCRAFKIVKKMDHYLPVMYQGYNRALRYHNIVLIRSIEIMYKKIPLWETTWDQRLDTLLERTWKQNLGRDWESHWGIPLSSGEQIENITFPILRMRAIKFSWSVRPKPPWGKFTLFWQVRKYFCDGFLWETIFRSSVSVCVPSLFPELWIHKYFSHMEGYI